MGEVRINGRKRLGMRQRTASYSNETPLFSQVYNMSRSDNAAMGSSPHRDPRMYCQAELPADGDLAEFPQPIYNKLVPLSPGCRSKYG